MIKTGTQVQASALALATQQNNVEYNAVGSVECCLPFDMFLVAWYIHGRVHKRTLVHIMDLKELR